MKARLLALLLPASIVGVIFGGSYSGYKLGFIPPPIWNFLWPSLVALLFLGFALGFWWLGARRWVWPTGAGFIVQTFNILCYAAGWGFESPWEVLWVTLSVVFVVVFVILILLVISGFRARQIEQMMQQGVGTTGADPQAVAEIRKNMLEALSRFKRAGLGRNAIYNFPWFLVIGRSGAGKTVAIKNSGLGLPVKDKVKGVSGTYTADWFFTNSLIFLDTPGKWIDEGTDTEDQQHWQELLRNLRRYRGRRPLDGIVVVVPADDLLSRSESEIQEQAAKIRQVIDLLQGELRFRFPIYLIVSKCDLVEGFVDFFKGLPVHRRNEILGWSHGDPNEGSPRKLIPRAFRRVLQRLQGFRLEILSRTPRATHARRLFFFTEEFRHMERPLSLFAGALLASDPYHQAPVFRGFYFTSGTQEGTPLGQAMSSLARALGVRVTAAQDKEEQEPKKSYFLLELFRNLMVSDQGLVGRTALHWWRSRRDTLLATFLIPVGLALLAFLFSLNACGMNKRTYQQIETQVPKLIRSLEKLPATSENVPEALGYTEKLRLYHVELTGVQPLRWGLGMRQPGKLSDQVFRIYRDQFIRHVLRPTLESAQEIATRTDELCTNMFDVFYSVVYLRMARRDEWRDDLGGFRQVWGVEEAEADQARQDLARQFSYWAENAHGERTMLPGFSLLKVSKSLSERCKDKGVGSGLEQYQKFQRDCRSPGTNSEITRCHDVALVTLLGDQGEKYDLLRAHIKGVRRDLEDLRNGETDAHSAHELIKDIRLPRAEANQCLNDFGERVVPAIKNYLEKEEAQINECRTQFESQGGRKLLAQQIVVDQTKQMKDQGDKLRTPLMEYSESCRESLHDETLDPDLLIRLSQDYRRVACMGKNVITGETSRAAVVKRIFAEGGAPPRAGEEAPERIPVPRRPSPGSWLWFDPPRAVSQSYTLQGWSTQKEEWSGDIQYAESLPPAQQATELGQIRQNVDVFANHYYEAWKGYLGSIKLKNPGGAVPGWLKSLAMSPEWGKLLQPAAQAVPPAGASEKVPLDAFPQRMAGLQSLSAFVNSDLGQYLDSLRQIGTDLEQCEKGPGACNRYWQQIDSQDKSNNLVKAREWVELKAGPLLAEGTLTTLFRQPLEKAAEYIRSPDLTRKQWSDLSHLYGSISKRFPFGGPDAVEMVDQKDFTALLGGQSGLVTALEDVSTQAGMPQGLKDWLAQASTLSRAFFERGKDDPKNLSLKITLDPPTFEPEELQERFRWDEIDVVLGEGAKIQWTRIEPTANIKTLLVALLGEEASVASSVEVKVAERKGAFGRALTKGDYKEGDWMIAAKADGFWAPVKLVEMGLRPYNDPASDTLHLTYLVKTIPYKKNQPGTLKINMRVKGAAIRPLLDLIRKGMTAPPVEGGGS